MLKNVFCYDIIEAELWDFNDIFVHPRKPYFSLKNKPFDLCFTFFLQNKLGLYPGNYKRYIHLSCQTSCYKTKTLKEKQLFSI